MNDQDGAMRRSRHRDAITLAAHITSESPGREPSSLAGTVAGLWSQKMWTAVAAEAGLPAPDTATQSLTVAILAGHPAAARTGDLSVGSDVAATCEQALRRWGNELARTGAVAPSPMNDQLQAKVRDALDAIEAPAHAELTALRSTRPTKPTRPAPTHPEAA